MQIRIFRQILNKLFIRFKIAFKKQKFITRKFIDNHMIINKF